MLDGRRVVTCLPVWKGGRGDWGTWKDGVQVKSGGGGVTCLATSGPRPGLASGSREGIITSWATDSGVALQTIDVSQVHALGGAKPLWPTARGVLRESSHACLALAMAWQTTGMRR